MSPSPAVYRRRRLVFLIVLILVIAAVAVGVWLAIAQPWASAKPAPSPTTSASPTTQTTTSPAPEESASPEPEESAGAAAACRGVDVTVEAVTDAESYADGALPALSISLTNNGSEPCTIDVGSATQVFTVSSGEDVWWRSTDCQENPSSMVVTLEAGQHVTSAEPLVWDRTRSDVSTCADANRPRATAGGASYHVGVSIGGFEAMNTRQIQLY